MNRYFSVVQVLMLTFLPFLANAQNLPEPENQQAPPIIRSIRIDNGNIFDMQDERENGTFYRVANSLHLKTRRSVIEQQLLFKVGDPYMPRLLLESERILRGNRYISDVTVQAVIDRNFVDVVVTTRDTWSTKPKINVSQSGGESKSEFGLKEENLLGMGVSADLSYKSDADRKSYIVRLGNDHFLNTWYALDLNYTSSSDGFEKYVALQKPFYSLATLSSNGLIYDDKKLTEAYYLLGEKYYEYSLEQTSYDLFYGWSSGLKNGSAIRHKLGWRYNDEIYSEILQSLDAESVMIDRYLAVHNLLPNDRKDSYPFYAFEYLQDRYKEVRNLDRIGKVEDRYMGLSGKFEIGYANTGFGSYDNNIRVDAGISKTIDLNPTSSLSSEANVSFRWQDSNADNFLSSLQFKYYKEQRDHFKFYADFTAVTGSSLDIQNQIFLGNETGLRGFPAHYLSGERMQKITLEERYYSDAKPFRIFGLGAALFVDVGRIAGGNEIEREHSGVYSNIGVGLRIANNRSARGDILHIDFAVPIGGDAPDKGFQINLQLKPTF